MKNSSYYTPIFRVPIQALLFIGLLLFPLLHSTAQTKVLADQVTYTSGNRPVLAGGGATVQNPNNALLNDDSYANLRAGAGILYSPYNAEIELKFNTTRPADSWSYVRIQPQDADLVEVLLGGSLGNLLGDLLGYLLTGNQEIVIDARMGSSSILSRSSTQGFGIDRVKLLKSGEGHFYLGIKPDSDYDRIRITNKVSALLGAEKYLRVFNAFYYEDDGADCGRPFATSFDGSSGLNLSLLNLGDQHLERAIDSDMDSYSTLNNNSLLGLQVATTLTQYFYFPTVSAATTSSVNIKLQATSSGLIDLDLLGSTMLIFYDGDDIVHERSLKSGLLHNTDVLALLQDQQPITMTLAPGVSFDRIAFSLNRPVGLDLINSSFRIYDVQRYDEAIEGCENPELPAPAEPTDDPFIESACADELLDFSNADFPHNAVDGNNETYATLYAESGDLLVNGATTGHLHFDVGPMSANETTYIRIAYDEEVLDRLLGGSLGKLVVDLAGNLLLGNQYIQVEALDNGTPVLDEDSQNAFQSFTDGIVRIVQDNIGRTYIAITPFSDYNSIRITNHVNAILSTGKTAALHVYNACHEIGDVECAPANFTSYYGGGISLSLNDISDAKVTDPYKAINANSSNYSKINLGIAGVAAHIYQSVYFNTESESGDHVQIRLMVEPSSVLSLDVLGTYKVKFYNGLTQVGPDYNLQDGLLNNIDLLALFNTGGSVTLDFEPEGIFDRVDIGIESIIGLNVDAEPLRVYSVRRYGDTCPIIPKDWLFDSASCGTTLIDAENADDVQNLFDGNLDSFATLRSGNGTIGNNVGFVEMEYPQMMDAGTTTYVRIDFDENILDALLGGTLGDIVADLLDGLLLGDHYFQVAAKNDDTVVLSGSSKDVTSSGNGVIRVVQDKDGRYYIAITPDAPYNRIRISDHTDAVLNIPPLTQSNEMNVYGMCTEISTGRCLDAFATSYDYTGLDLSVEQLGAAGVTNPERAIDDNTNHYSEISNGTLTVLGARTRQWIFYNSVSWGNDLTQIRLKTQGGGVDVDVLGNLEIKAYLGETEVAQFNFQNGLINGINVIDLLNNNQIITLDFYPGVNYDRISVGIINIISVSVMPAIHLYSVKRMCTSEEFIITNPHIHQKVKYED